MQLGYDIAIMAVLASFADYKLSIFGYFAAALQGDLLHQYPANTSLFIFCFGTFIELSKPSMASTIFGGPQV